MTNMTSRATMAWNRRDYLPYGQRLHSNPELAAWIAGKPMRPACKEVPAPLSPEAAAAPWHPEHWLDRLADNDDGDRYMSVTARITRVANIQRQFYGICKGFVTPVRFTRRRGIPVLMENDGPTAFWRAWTAMVWASMPANDSDIFPRSAATTSPKLKHLAERLMPMLAWRANSTQIRFGGTNWLQADNDNYDVEEPEQKPASNLERRMRPGSSDAELMTYIGKAGPTVEWRHAKYEGGGEVERRPINVTRQAGVIVRAGKLRIANGETTSGSVRIEKGTVLHQPDKFGELLGPEPGHREKVRSATYFASLFKVDRDSVVMTDEDGTEHPRFVKTGKMRRKVLLTEEDRRALLAGPLPPVTYCPPGLPRGAEDFGSHFVGGWISQTKGKAPLERWEDISDEMARQAEFERWVAALPPEQVKALDLATVAANFQQIGEAFGKQEKTAERFGKKAVVAANDNLQKIMAA